MSFEGGEQGMSTVLAWQLSRRSLLRRSIVLGVGVSAAGGLLAACGGDDDDDEGSSSATGATPTPAAETTPTQSAAATEDADSGTTPEATAEATEETGSSEPGEDSPASGTVVVADGTEPESLSPPHGTGTGHIINILYEGLVLFSRDRELVPALATSWEASEDGTEWIFDLREGVKFHDGTDFTSTAVRISYENLMNPDLVANRRGNYLLIQEVDDSEEYSVRFVTDPPNPDFAALMSDGSSFIVSPAALEAHGDDFGRNPIGTGPYSFVEWIPNEHVLTERFEDYWGEKPSAQNVIYRSIPEVSTRVVVLRTGEVDVVFGLPASDMESLEQEDGLTVHTEPSLSVVMMEPRVSLPPLDDARVRRALNMAIDKSAILTSIMKGAALPLNTPGVPGLPETIELEPVPFDPDQAKALLAEAGYPDGIDVNITYTGGRFAGDDQLVQAIQGFWAQVGVRANITRVDYTTFVATLRIDPMEMAGEILMPSRSSVTNDYHLYRMYHTEATHADAAQRSGYSNPAVDELLAAQRREFDPERRKEMFAQIQELLWEDQPMIFLQQQVDLWGQRDNVSGFELTGQGDFRPAQVQKT